MCTQARVHTNSIHALEFSLGINKPTVAPPDSTLTKFVPDHCHFRRLRGFPDSCRVGAAHAEAVGLPLGQVEEGEARGLHRELRVHPLPVFRARVTLRRE